MHDKQIHDKQQLFIIWEDVTYIDYQYWILRVQMGPKKGKKDTGVDEDADKV